MNTQTLKNCPFTKRTAEDEEQLKKIFGTERANNMMNCTSEVIARIKQLSKEAKGVK